MEVAFISLIFNAQFFYAKKQVFNDVLRLFV
jgi:hypothetical protein